MPDNLLIPLRSSLECNGMFDRGKSAPSPVPCKDLLGGLVDSVFSPLNCLNCMHCKHLYKLHSSSAKKMRQAPMFTFLLN